MSSSYTEVRSVRKLKPNHTTGRSSIEHKCIPVWRSIPSGAPPAPRPPPHILAQPQSVLKGAEEQNMEDTIIWQQDGSWRMKPWGRASTAPHDNSPHVDLSALSTARDEECPHMSDGNQQLMSGDNGLSDEGWRVEDIKKEQGKNKKKQSTRWRGHWPWPKPGRSRALKSY